MVRFQSSLQEKEKGDESRYFKAEEAKRLAEIRANVEKIMSSENDERKDDLIELLATKPEADKSGIISKLGLDDWKFALPVGMFIAIPTLANEVLVLNAETQLVACFIIFASTMYTSLGGPVAKYLDSVADERYANLRKFDDAVLKEVLDGISENQKVIIIILNLFFYFQSNLINEKMNYFYLLSLSKMYMRIILYSIGPYNG